MTFAAYVLIVLLIDWLVDWEWALIARANINFENFIDI